MKSFEPRIVLKETRDTHYNKPFMMIKTGNVT